MDYIQGDDAIEWTQSRMYNRLGFDEPMGFGIVKGGKIVAGIVYDNWQPKIKSICVSVAIDDKRALNKEVIMKSFKYPFELLECNRITCFVSSNNLLSIKLCLRLGLKLEGIMRENSHCTDGIKNYDLLVFGMLRSECRWTGENIKKMV